jgi:predicted RNA binding protein YcfA (HicA-like mRNA interferase family)
LPKLPIIDAKEAEKMLLKAGFSLIRSKGSHRIYIKNKIRIIIPFHSSRSLHPKIVKDLLEALK